MADVGAPPGQQRDLPPDDRFQQLFTAIDEGYCLCEIVVDDAGDAVDYRFLETNPLFEEMTGLADAVGHTAMELVPDLEREWVEVYARAAIGGERLRFEQGSAAMGRWFDVFTMPVGGDGRFAIVFKDETERHRAEIELRDSQEQLRRLADQQRDDDLLRLQHALLPAAVVESEHVRIVAHYQSIAAGTDVGGDWYDTFRWGDGRVGVMVGDVVGHNLDAAAEMGHLRAGVGALARGQAVPGPSALLHALDECARGPDGTDFVTACCVVYDPSSGRLDHASAGHPPPLLVPPDLDARWLDGALTPPIGRIVVADRPHGTAAVPAGSVVILYSDGLIERRGLDLDRQLERVRTHAVDLVGAGDDDVARRLVERMADDAPLEDDVVVVVASIV